MENTKKQVNYLLMGLWFFFPIAVVTGQFHSIVEGIIILTPLLAFGFYGRNWLLQKYNWSVVILSIIGLFFGITIITQFIPWHSVTSLDCVRSFHIKFILIGFSILFIVSKPEMLKSFCWGCVAAMAVAALGGYAEYIFGRDFFPWKAEESWPNAISPFGYHKNQFAAYFSYYLPVLLGFGMGKISASDWKDWRPWFIFLVIIFSIPVLILTLGRAAQGTFVIAVIVFAFFWIIQKYKISWKLPCILIGLLIFITVLSSLLLATDTGNKALWRWEPDYFERSLSGRVENHWRPYYEQTWKQDLQWFGLNFSRELIDKTLEVRSHEHNIYLSLFTRSGILGTVSFLALFLTLLVISVIKMLHTDDKLLFPILLGFFSSFIGALLIQGIVTNNYYYQLELWCSFLLALSLLRRNKALKQAKNIQSSRKSGL